MTLWLKMTECIFKYFKYFRTFYKVVTINEETENIGKREGLKRMHLLQRMIFRIKLEFAILYFTAIKTSMVVLMALVHTKKSHIFLYSLNVYVRGPDSTSSKDKVVNSLRNINPGNFLCYTPFYICLLKLLQELSGHGILMTWHWNSVFCSQYSLNTECFAFWSLH